MAYPARNADANKILSSKRTFFVTTKTHMSRRIFQVERNALLLIDILRSLATERKFRVLDFVIMPDHLHLLLEVDREMTIEKAMQFVKGRFSHKMKAELGMKGEIWQRGFTDSQIMTQIELESHREYIAQNPVKAGLAVSVDEYPYCYRFLSLQKAQGLKPE